MTARIPLRETDSMSDRLRLKTWRPNTRELLLARIEGSDQENDLSVPPNCGGLGRLHHFRRETSDGWPPNPLPIDPACRFLGIPSEEMMVAQVFQNLACNWRCWYCYVPFSLLNGNPRLGAFVTAQELVDRHFTESLPASVIDVSGGQPDLIPEWTLDMLRAIERCGAERSTYVWSDDNLSTDALWRFLSSSDIGWMASRHNHGRVGCFKGFDESSFSFNTRAAPELFERQFRLFDQLRRDGFDLYGYITLTTPNTANIERGIIQLVDRLQEIHPNVPLRVVPLEIGVFGPVEPRLTDANRQALENQNRCVEVWNQVLEERFTAEQRGTVICDINIRD